MAVLLSRGALRLCSIAMVLNADMLGQLSGAFCHRHVPG